MKTRHIPPSTPGSWLVMIYLAGDSGLTDEMVAALQDLVEKGESLGSRVVAQLDPSGTGLDTSRFDLTAPKETVGGAPLDRFLIEKVTDRSTGSVETLTAFIRWARKRDVRESPKNQAATQFLLILAGHGSGVTEDFFLRDDASSDSLGIQELRRAMQKAKRILGKRIDVLGMDACYMAMAEIAYELRDHVDVLVGAEGSEPSFGWPYSRFLTVAKTHYREKKRHMTSAQLGTMIVREYIDTYADYDATAGRSVDLTAIRPAQIAKLVPALKELVKQLLKGSRESHDRVLLAHWYAQTYKFDQYVDLLDLCHRLALVFQATSPIGRAAKNLANVLEGRGVPPAESIVVLSGCSGFACQYSYGVSIYFPWTVVGLHYTSLTFVRRTGWHEFLKKHIALTRRPPRFGGDSLCEAKRRAGLRHVTKAPLELEARGAGIKRMSKAQLHDLQRRFEKAKEEAIFTDMPPQDMPKVMAQALAATGSFRYSAKTRYGDSGDRYSAKTRSAGGSRYSAKTRGGNPTRSLEERETLVKNLAPVVGKTFFPAKGEEP